MRHSPENPRELELIEIIRKWLPIFLINSRGNITITILGYGVNLPTSHKYRICIKELGACSQIQHKEESDTRNVLMTMQNILQKN